MKFYKVRILKAGALQFIEKNVCAENIETAKDIVIGYVIKLCAGEEKHSQLGIVYHYKSAQEDEISFKTNFSIPSKGDAFEFKIEVLRDTKLEKFPEEIDIFNFINFPALVQK